MLDFIKNHWFLWIMLSIATVLVFVWLFVFNRKKLQIKLPETIIITVIFAFFGVFSVVLFGFAESGFNPKRLGSISLFGGIFFMPIAFYLYSLIRKKNVKLVFDVFTPIVVIALTLSRINCLHAGCCYGIEVGSSGIRVPTREIELFFQAIFLIFVIPLILNNKYRGHIYPTYMIGYGVTRFITEWFRDTETTMPLHFGHIWSLVAIVIGAAFIAFMLLKNKKARVEDAQ